jgi:hypothetical protein
MQHPRGHTRKGNLHIVGAMMQELHPDHWWLPRRADFAFAQTDCTFLTISGQRWQRERGPGCVAMGLQLADSCWRLMRAYRCPYGMENPARGKLASGWVLPDYIFDPWEFSGYLLPSDECPLAAHDAYAKQTGLWTGGGFVFPRKKPWMGMIETPIHDMGPDDNRADKRSVTPMGFARAVFAANNRRNACDSTQAKNVATSCSA